jgi:hypothetical protein
MQSLRFTQLPLSLLSLSLSLRLRLCLFSSLSLCLSFSLTHPLSLSLPSPTPSPPSPPVGLDTEYLLGIGEGATKEERDRAEVLLVQCGKLICILCNQVGRTEVLCVVTSFYVIYMSVM